MKKVNNFQIARVQHQGIAELLLNTLKFRKKELSYRTQSTQNF